MKALFLRADERALIGVLIQERSYENAARECEPCGKDFQEFESKTGTRFNVDSVFQHVFQLFFIFSGRPSH